MMPTKGPDEKAKQILNVTGVGGGLIVYVNCGEGLILWGFRRV